MCVAELGSELEEVFVLWLAFSGSFSQAPYWGS